MKVERVRPDPQPAHSCELLVLKAMLVYEDTDCGLRAKLALEHLPEEFKVPDQCGIKFWRRDLLSLPWLREQAAQDAGDANVIIVSIEGQGPVPGEIKDWLNRWLHHKGNGRCALGYIASEQSIGKGKTNPTMEYVQRIAEAGNAIFFWGIESFNPVRRGGAHAVDDGLENENSPGFPEQEGAIAILQ